METTKINSNSKLKALLALLSLSAALIFITSIIMHITPLKMADSILDFASHHYFIMGFISLIIMALSLKSYRSLDNAINRHFHENRMIGYTRATKRKKLIQSLLQKAYYSTQKLKSQAIDKSNVKELKFIEKDVLSSEQETIERRDNLQKAMMLGNAIKHKVKIFFKDAQSNKHVETTVWHADTKHISLKGGITLPVNSIYKVEI